MQTETVFEGFICEMVSVFHLHYSLKSMSLFCSLNGGINSGRFDCPYNFGLSQLVFNNVYLSWINAAMHFQLYTQAKVLA